MPSPLSAAPRLLGEPVARPAHGLDVDGLRGVGLDLLADMADVHHDRRVVADGIEPPDACEKALAAEDDAGMLREEGEELELEVRERDLAPALRHAAARRVDDEIAAAQARLQQKADARALKELMSPVQANLTTGRVYISTQNHNYVIKEDTIDPKQAKVWFKNVNDKTIEGLEYLKENIKSIQFHPEACGGPLDTMFLFEKFMTRMEEEKTCR